MHTAPGKGLPVDARRSSLKTMDILNVRFELGSPFPTGGRCRGGIADLGSLGRRLPLDLPYPGFRRCTPAVLRPNPYPSGNPDLYYACSTTLHPEGRSTVAPAHGRIVLHGL